MQYHYLNFLTTKLCCWFSQSQSVRDFGTILNIYSIICSHRQPLSIFYFSIGWSNSMGKYMVDDNNNSFRIWYRGFWSGVYFFFPLLLVAQLIIPNDLMQRKRHYLLQRYRAVTFLIHTTIYYCIVIFIIVILILYRDALYTIYYYYIYSKQWLVWLLLTAFTMHNWTELHSTVCCAMRSSRAMWVCPSRCNLKQKDERDIILIEQKTPSQFNWNMNIIIIIIIYIA